MAKDKKHNKPQRRNLAMHSKQTGAIILIVLAVLLVGGSAFFYLAHLENEKYERQLDQFQLLSCEEMNNNIKQDRLNIEFWKHEVYQNKLRAGEC